MLSEQHMHKTSALPPSTVTATVMLRKIPLINAANPTTQHYSFDQAAAMLTAAATAVVGCCCNS
jgi:hypothetical protein